MLSQIFLAFLEQNTNKTKITLMSPEITALYRRIGFLPIALLLTLIVRLFFMNFGTKMPIEVNQGTGFDGIHYVVQAQKFQEFWNDRKLNLPIDANNLAKVDRWLTSGLVAYGMDLVGVEKTIPNVIRAFEYHNLLWALSAVVAWWLIAGRLRLSENGKWLGLVFFQASAAILKIGTYYPTLTDTAAACLALWLIAFFLLESWIGMLGMMVVALMGAFLWQPVLIFAYLLFLFPKNTSIIDEPNPIINWAVKILPAFLFFVGLWATQYFKLGYEIFVGLPQYGQIPFSKDGLWLSVLLALGFVALFYYYLFINTSLKNLWYFVKPSIEEKNITNILIYNAKRIVPILILYFAVKYIHDLVSPLSGAVGEQSSGVITGLASSVVSNPLATISGYGFFNAWSLHYPFEFYVFQASYFGVFFIIALVFYKQLAQIVRSEMGLGIMLVLIASISTGIMNPQSRIGTASFPFIMVLATLLADRKQWTQQTYIILIITSLVASKVWFSIFLSDSQDVQTRVMSSIQYFYFVETGTWSPANWYMGFAFCFVGLAAYLFWADRSQQIKVVEKPSESQTIIKPKGKKK